MGELCFMNAITHTMTHTMTPTMTHAQVTCAYLEVYNEILFDLLVKNSGPLELREDADQGVQVAGLKHVAVETAGEILVSVSVSVWELGGCRWYFRTLHGHSGEGTLQCTLQCMLHLIDSAYWAGEGRRLGFWKAGGGCSVKGTLVEVGGSEAAGLSLKRCVDGHQSLVH